MNAPPADWKEVRLGECLTIMHGKNQSQIVDPEGRYPILATGGVIGRTNSYLSKKPSVLIGRKGTIDRPQYMDTPFWTVDTLFYSEVKSENSAKFLFFKFLMVDWKKYNEASGVPSLNASTIENIEVMMPPLKEQEAIAEALSDADAAIESLDALIAKKRDVKQAAMQQLLTGRTRLPGFTADWKEVRLGEIAEIISGGTPSTAIGAYWGGDIPWCTPTDITSCKSNYLFDTERKITPAGLAGSAASLLPPGSLLLCTRATVGDVRIAGRAIATNQGFKSLVVNSQANSKFVYFVLQTLRQAMIEKSSGSTFLELGKNDLSNIVALMPPVKEQEAIAEALTVIDDELEALTEQVSKLRMVKEGMMQDLLTGKVRLV